MLQSLANIITKWLIRLNIDPQTAEKIAGLSDFVVLFLVSGFVYYGLRLVIIPIVKRISKRTHFTWDDAVVQHKVIQRILLFLVWNGIYNLIPATLSEFPGAINGVQRVIAIFTFILFMRIILALINTGFSVYQSTQYAIYHPIKGFVQVGKIIIYIISALVVLSILINQPLTYFLGGMGAFSAVLMLVFKDSILGFVGGLQISANDMVRIGDWISMSKSGADGEVVDISLTTVKVQNWDKTITTIPTYSLVSDSFTNHRGMVESPGRRIKRSVFIDINSVKFCTSEMLERFSNIEIVRNYISEKEKELAEFNSLNQISDQVLVNGKRQTNIGIFRAYLTEFLKLNPDINQEMTIIVRQLQPTENGIPIEIYVFSKEKAWSTYENIQSDIFDHILAAVKHFDLKIFQSPTGDDFKAGMAEESSGKDDE